MCSVIKKWKMWKNFVHRSNNCFSREIPTQPSISSRLSMLKQVRNFNTFLSRRLTNWKVSHHSTNHIWDVFFFRLCLCWNLIRYGRLMQNTKEWKMSKFIFFVVRWNDYNTRPKSDETALGKKQKKKKRNRGEWVQLKIKKRNLKEKKESTKQLYDRSCLCIAFVG